MSGHDFAQISERLDHNPFFATMRNTPYYADAVYPRFSPAEYARRYRLTREKMARLGLDCLVVGGAPSHWSYGSGVTWLSGHREWHCMAVYMVVPLEGEPTLVYSMGGTHAEATRRAVSVKDVRQSRLGRFAEVIAERVAELGLAEGRIGVTAVDPHYMDYMPINQWRTLREKLPNAALERVGDFFHEFLALKSPEEQAYVARAGELCALAMEAMVAAARPGATEYQLKAAAAGAIYEGGGEVDFLIIGSSPMDDPAIIFGNPRPSRRALQKGDIVVNELAASFEGYSAQIGVPICVGEPSAQVREMFDEIVLPGYRLMEQHLRPGGSLRDIWLASRFFRERGYQSRPVQLHGIDLVSQSPHIYAEELKAHDYELIIKPGMTLMLEPNPITADGRLGLFLGHTYQITESGSERVTGRVPLELLVAEA
ncbi:MAG TPA: Xaa-Pro peptidase family protein [Chloroflexaceae bacterium]|nr:Xaa-Pro peptidase family protein [Chloroflexaceae bacterium]